MTFTRLTLPLIIVMAAGCSTPKIWDEQQLSLLSNDELCRSLGKYNDSGTAVLKIHAEIMRRESSINNERCYALENSAHSMSSGISVEPTASPSQQERVFSKDKGKTILQQSGPRAGLDIRIP